MTDRFAVSVLATPEAVAELVEQLLGFLEECGVDARATHHVTLIVEEIMTNLGSHGSCRDYPAELVVDVDADGVHGDIADRGAPFDLTKAEDPELHDDVEDRKVGGLGLFLVRQLSSSLAYEHRDGTNHTRFTVARS